MSSPKKIALPMKPDAANRTAAFSDQYDRMDATACGAVRVTAREVGGASMVVLDLSSTHPVIVYYVLVLYARVDLVCDIFEPRISAHRIIFPPVRILGFL